MMRIVCPNCGEEPQKGQRHYCRPPVGPRPQVELALDRKGMGFDHHRESIGGTGGPSAGTDAAGGGLLAAQRRTASSTTPSVVCTSIASLVSKNSALWRSGKALARCGATDFVAGLFAMAVSLACWHRDPKRALLTALLGRVADEAARAIQIAWRCQLQARAAARPVNGVSGGYQQLVVTQRRPLVAAGANAVRAAAPACRSLPNDRRAPLSDASRGKPPALALANVAFVPPALPSPRQPETPRNKSNPRPTGVRAVPTNPIKALKQRKEQHQLEIEERRLQQLQEAEERRAARNQAFLPQSPQAQGGQVQPEVALETGGASMALAGEEERSSRASECKARASTPDGRARPSTPDGIRTDGMLINGAIRQISAPSTPRSVAAGRPPHPGTKEDVALTPLERRALRASGPASARGTPAAVVARDSEALQTEGETQSAPATFSGWRPSATTDSPRTGSPGPISAQSPSATERIRERLKQRGNSTSTDARANRPQTSAAAAWQERIELRRREAEDIQELELEEKQRTSERSSRRNDAMRRVMERQAQRQHEVQCLDEG